MTNPLVDQERLQFLEARKASSTKKGLLPAWPRTDKELPLVDLDVKWVRFSTLNHRTKSEQMRIVKQRGETDLFTADPLGTEAQKEQFAILSGQEGFADLKADLRDRGQQDPAVVTSEGVLINGNRRSAALRSLFLDDTYRPAQYVKCLVLPADATLAELVDIETELQIARDFKVAYTWVNEALLIEELFDREGKSWAKVASRMHKPVADVRTQYEKLQQLHQLVHLSNGTRHHADFVLNESAFTELARHIKGKPAAEAASVRDAYFLGTLTGVNYRVLRHLQRADASALVRQELEAEVSLAPLLTPAEEEAATDEIDLLDDVLGGGGDGGTQQQADLKNVLSFLARNGGEQEIEVAGQKVQVEDLMRSVKAAVDQAADEASSQAEEKTTVTSPTELVAAALKKLAKAKEALPKARVIDQWKEDAFQARLAELKATVAELEKPA